MINALITSQTRVKLLKKFFLNCNTSAYLRGLESEFGESSNAIRVELNRFESAGLLNSLRDSNKKVFKANKSHPLYKDIHNIILKETRIDLVIENVIQKQGNPLAVYLIGDFAHSKDSSVIDLILVCKETNSGYLSRKILQAEKIVGRRVNCIILKKEEAKAYIEKFKPSDILPLWETDLTGLAIR